MSKVSIIYAEYIIIIDSIYRPFRSLLGLYRLLPFIRKIPWHGKNLTLFFQLVLRVPPLLSQCISIYLPVCFMYYVFLNISEDLRGNGRVWQLIVVLLEIRWGCLVFEGLEEDIFFHVLLLDFLCSLELLEDFLAYEPFCYHMQAFVCKKVFG